MSLERRVYEEWLGLPVPEGMADEKYIVVGEFAPDSSPELVGRLVAEARKERGHRDPYTLREFARLAKNGTVLERPELEDFDPETPDGNKGSQLYRLKRAREFKIAESEYKIKRGNERKLLSRLKGEDGDISADFKGYMGYLAMVHKKILDPFFRPWRLPILEEDRKRHTKITGKSGFGKSTLLKVLIYNYLRKRGKVGVILFDPHGDVAKETAALRENLGSERLVYFDPLLRPGYTPVINPLEIEDKTPQAVELATNELIQAFRSVLENSTPPTQFTPQMEQVLKPCISALMIRPNSTLEDLMDFMDREKCPPLVAYAAKVLENPVQVEFMENDFNKDTFDYTKQSIRTKLMILLNSNVFRLCLCGKSTVDLRKEMDRGAAVIFKLSTGILSEETASAMGRFFIARIQSLAQQREAIPEHMRHPVHMFVDECELFISDKIEKILKESRKYKLHLTLAQQVFGLNMSEKLKKTILGNTAVKITGGNEQGTLKTMSNETGVDVKELGDLYIGEFHVKSGNRPSVKVKVPNFLSNGKFTMSAEEWKRTEEEQIAKYYRKIGSVKTRDIPIDDIPIIDLD